ncbi:MAG: hypothetical protein JRI74_02785 [Deltaproteobacteria bacterium]|nr:hypothetical protein [Deltaproteobacteria bacterium]
MCGHAFCGTDHMLFATDMPFDNELGERFTRQTIEAIEQMDIDNTDKNKIFEQNISKMIRIPG